MELIPPAGLSPQHTPVTLWGSRGAHQTPCPLGAGILVQEVQTHPHGSAASSHGRSVGAQGAGRGDPGHASTPLGTSVSLRSSQRTGPPGLPQKDALLGQDTRVGAGRSPAQSPPSVGEPQAPKATEPAHKVPVWFRQPGGNSPHPVVPPANDLPPPAEGPPARRARLSRAFSRGALGRLKGGLRSVIAADAPTEVGYSSRRRPPIPRPLG